MHHGDESCTRVIAGLACALLIGAAQPRLAPAQELAPSVNPPDPHPSAAAEAAQRKVDAAVQAVASMKQDPHVVALLAAARGVLIVPHYREGAAIIGGHGGVGVLLARRHGVWSDPVFYRLGGVSIGLQAGGASGTIALFLMNDQAVDQFRDQLSTWSLGGRAGLTVADFSKQRQHLAKGPDVIVWTHVKGLFGGASLGATDVTPDTSSDHAYYHSPVAPLQILVGAVRNPRADALREALDTPVALN